MPSKSKSKSKSKAAKAPPLVQEQSEVVETVQEQVVEQSSSPDPSSAPVKAKSKPKKKAKAKTSNKAVADTTPVEEQADISASSTSEDAGIQLTRTQALKHQRKYENSTTRNFNKFSKMLTRFENSITKNKYANEKDMQNFQNLKELFDSMQTSFQHNVEVSKLIRDTSRPKKNIKSSTSGFVEKKPQPMLYMSPQLKTLLEAVKDENFNVGNDNMIQRGDAVKGISLYVKENELKNGETKEIEYTSKSKNNMLYTLKEVTKDGQTAQIQSSKGEKVAIASPTTETFTQKDIFSLVAGHVSKVPF